MFPSTMILPDRHLQLIHAHQRELREEVADLATARFAATTRNDVLSRDLQQRAGQRHAPSRRQAAALWWWLSAWLVGVRMRGRSFS